MDSQDSNISNSINTEPSVTPDIDLEKSKPKDSKRVIFVPKRVTLSTKKAVELLLNGSLTRKVCRYCLHITSPLSELNQILHIGNKEAVYRVTIRDVVASFHPFKVTNDRNFPNKICENCLNKALQAYLFAQQCEQSERALRNCFDDMYNKVEKLDPLERISKRGRQKQNPNHNILYTEHFNVIDYAEPLRNLINVGVELVTKGNEMSELECKRCWQVLPDLESLANHEKLHPDTMWYHCRTCGKSFPKKFHINRHLKQHSKNVINNKFEEEKMEFECKQCGIRNTDYNLHLQHIEKHKFKMVLEHLVEKKMDNLCTVCLDNTGRMVGMDKIICLNGGYPELNGDHTLFNILGSVLPKPNYKYQELLIAERAKILKISQKRPENINNIIILQKPIIISTQTFIASGAYSFHFSAPMKDIAEIIDPKQNSCNFIDKKVECKDVTMDIPDLKITDTNSDNKLDDSGANDDMEDEYGGNYSRNNDNDVVIAKYGNDIDKIKQIIPKLCNNCWIFNKPLCVNCSVSNDNGEIVEDKKSTFDKEDLSKIGGHSCQYCWVFQKAGKCDNCLQPTEDSIKIDKDVIRNVDSLGTVEGITESVNNDCNETNTEVAVISLSNKAQKRKIDDDTSEAKKAKWQCNICLTCNTSNRETCLCCESNNTYEESIKLNFNLNSFDFKEVVDAIEQPNNEENAIEEKIEAISMVAIDNDVQEVTVEKLEAMEEQPTYKEDVIFQIFPLNDTCITNNCEDSMDIEPECETSVPEDMNPIPFPIETQVYPNPFAFGFSDNPINFEYNMNPIQTPDTTKMQFNIGRTDIGDRFKRKPLKKGYRRVGSMK